MQSDLQASFISYSTKYHHSTALAEGPTKGSLAFQPTEMGTNSSLSLPPPLRVLKNDGSSRRQRTPNPHQLTVTNV